MKCFICNGTNKIIVPKRRNIEECKRKAIALREMGFTYEEIMKALGYKSPRSVAIQLNNKIK